MKCNKINTNNLTQEAQNRLLSLLTQKERNQLTSNWKINQDLLDQGKDVNEFSPVIKLFNPTGVGTWLISELSPDNIGFGICHLFEYELGYVSLDELNSLKLPIPIEKDRHFSAAGLTIYELIKVLTKREDEPEIAVECTLKTDTKDNVEHTAQLLVKDHIIYDQNHLVNTCLNDYTFDHGDISNMYSYFDQNGNRLLDEKLKEAQARDDFNELYHEENNEDEIFTWYLVTKWLARKLNKKGEMILENEHGTWWGRTCFGQRIVCDSVIQEIAKENY